MNPGETSPGSGIGLTATTVEDGRDPTPPGRRVESVLPQRTMSVWHRENGAALGPGTRKRPLGLRAEEGPLAHLAPS